MKGKKMLNRYDEFEDLRVADEMLKDEDLKTFMERAEEGFFPHIKMELNSLSDSFVCVALDYNSTKSKVYCTSDPKKALVAFVMRREGIKNSSDMKEFLDNDNGAFLRYIVYPGRTPLSFDEIVKKFNLSIHHTVGDAIPFYTQTPVIHSY